MGTDDPAERAERVAQRRRLLRVGVIGLGDDSDAFDRDYFRSLPTSNASNATSRGRRAAAERATFRAS